MKTVLCFGDSNTHGTSPHDWSRFDIHTRWPGVMRDQLGDNYWVIEEGCGGRTTVHDDLIEEPFQGGSKNGAAYLRPCLHSHAPLDLVVILLGSNDLKARFGVGADDIARSVGVLVQIVQTSTYGPDGTSPEVLLIAPPPTASLEKTAFADMFASGEAKSKRLGSFCELIAKERGCHFLDAGDVIVSSPVDGLHWDAPEHAKLGNVVAERVREILR